MTLNWIAAPPRASIFSVVQRVFKEVPWRPDDFGSSP